MSDLFTIDLNRLDEEWNDQLNLHQTWSDKVARRKKRRLEAEANLEVVTAEVTKQIRKQPTKFGLDKDAREAEYKAAVILHPKRREANQKVIDAIYQEDMAKGALEVVKDKKYAIQDDVKMLLSDIFAKPHVEVDEDMKEGLERLNRKRIVKGKRHERRST